MEFDPSEIDHNIITIQIHNVCDKSENSLCGPALYSKNSCNVLLIQTVIPGSYPRQQHPSYPTQPTYPTQPYAQAPPGAQQLPTGYNQSYPSYSQHTTAPPYGVPPPPYSATVNPQNQLHAGTLPVTAGYQYVHVRECNCL